MLLDVKWSKNTATSCSASEGRRERPLTQSMVPFIEKEHLLKWLIVWLANIYSSDEISYPIMSTNIQ